MNLDLKDYRLCTNDILLTYIEREITNSDESLTVALEKTISLLGFFTPKPKIFDEEERRKISEELLVIIQTRNTTTYERNVFSYVFDTYRALVNNISKEQLFRLNNRLIFNFIYHFFKTAYINNIYRSEAKKIYENKELTRDMKLNEKVRLYRKLIQLCFENIIKNLDGFTHKLPI